MQQHLEFLKLNLTVTCCLCHCCA